MKSLNWGLIGAGDIARKRVAPALRDLPNCNLLAINRSQYKLAEAFAREFAVPRWYENWQDLIADREVEAIYIATPVYLHKEQTVAAAEAGKHVLCEKPMALDVKQCDQMIAAARANGVRLGVAYYRRFYPVIERIREIVAAGEIGKLIVVQMNAFERFDPSPDHPRRWLIEKEKSGGGPMMDFGCHRLEVLTNLFGSVRRLKSVVANIVFERSVEDTAVAVLEFENGVCASLTVTHAAIEPQDTLDIFGTGGSIHVPILNKARINIKTENGDRTEFHPPASNIHEPLIADFTDAVLTNREPQVNGETGRTMAILEKQIYDGSQI